jgi:hypothetical protein
MGKFLDSMACPKTGVVEFSHPLDQSGQARCHLWLSLILIDEQTPPTALDGSIDVFLVAMVTKR